MPVAELRKAIAAKSDAQIRQWQHGYANRRPSPLYCTRIEKATGGLVSRKDLHPNDWIEIWPELEFAPPSIPAFPHSTPKPTPQEATHV